MNAWDKLKKDIIDAGLCTRCGTCAGLSKDIVFQDVLGKCEPVLEGNPNKIPDICYKACSGRDVDFPLLNKFVFDSDYRNFLLGDAQYFGVGFSKNKDVRQHSGSGGIATSVLLYLLKNKLVDGAVVLGMDKSQPYKSQPMIATSEEEILSCMQSKYSISPVNTILDAVNDFDGDLAYVGLPCQVHSIRKLQKLGHPAAKKIKYVIGLYCGNILHFDSVRSFLRSSGVSDLDDVLSLEYRAGEWPGHLQVKLKNGKIFKLRKFYANYLIPFYIMKRCLLCTDLSNEFADISCGDAWAPVYEERGKGWSIVIGRTKLGADLLKELQESNDISLDSITRSEAIAMHSHSLELKKVSNFVRVFKNRHHVNYGYKPINLTFKQKFFSKIMDFVFFVCRLNFIRKIVSILPGSFVGKFFDSARKRWKKLTKRRGKRDITSVKFE